VYVAAQAADKRWLVDAIQILDPAAALDQATGTNVLTEPKEEFSLDTAQRLAALAPSDSTRRQAVELLGGPPRSTSGALRSTSSGAWRTTCC